MATSLAMRALGLFGRGGRFRSLPLASGWTSVRDFPAPEGPTFQSLWRERRRA
jgi:L-lactate dehydrogenase complex protein LldF